MVQRDGLCHIKAGLPGNFLCITPWQRVNHMALPCRIAVFTEQGQTKIGLIKPAQMLLALAQDAALVDLVDIANEVEIKTIQMVNEAQ